ncbi:MAG: type II toxin-antitoxin system PemK/MazF family toxin [Jiangellaceae bacterium]
MRRGDVFLVEFQPSRGRDVDVDQTRPAVVVSSDAANRAAERAGRGVVAVTPVTSNTDRVFPFQVLLPAEPCGLPTESKAQAEQVRVISVGRLQRKLGRVPARTMRQLDEALRRHLAL